MWPSGRQQQFVLLVPDWMGRIEQPAVADFEDHHCQDQARVVPLSLQMLPDDFSQRIRMKHATFEAGLAQQARSNQIC
jgi:hypothetical protein